MPWTEDQCLKCLLGPVAAALIIASQFTQACALEPTINGGFTVSHPASIGVAVAVANARSKGVLPATPAEPVPNKKRLKRMLADLRRLTRRLDTGRKSMAGQPRSFSLVLIGPGLWTHFHTSSAAILPRYHTTGPLAGKVSVVTHHAVLKKLLDGSLTVEEAVGLGLLAYADGDPLPVRQLFDAALRSS